MVDAQTTNALSPSGIGSPEKVIIAPSDTSISLCMYRHSEPATTELNSYAALALNGRMSAERSRRTRQGTPSERVITPESCRP